MNHGGVLIVLILLGCGSMGWTQEMRVWTDKKGRQITAAIEEVVEGKVHIRKQNGQRSVLTTDTLSQADRRYLNRYLAQQRRKEAQDLGRHLLKPESWTAARLPGLWRESSRTEQEIIRQTARKIPVFGEYANVLAYYRQDKLCEILVTYLEEGNFVGYRGDGPVDPDKERERLRQELVERRKKAFRERFAFLADKLPETLTKLTESEGRRTRVGKGDLRKRVIQFQTEALVLNLDLQQNHLIALRVLPAEDFDHRMRTAGNKSGGRHRAVKENVKVSKNGDHKITNIPMIEQGSRGYCAVGTLTMIMRYYGINADIDAMAAAAGYKEGAPDGSIITIYKSAAQIGKLRYNDENTVNLRKIQKAIDRGQPVLVWRHFSRTRDAYHSSMTSKILINPKIKLPKPDREERQKWPTTSDWGHASLITGYNKKRGEILFSESWTRQYTHRRMREEEFEATTYHLFYFTP